MNSLYWGVELEISFVARLVLGRPMCSVFEALAQAFPFCGLIWASQVAAQGIGAVGFVFVYDTLVRFRLRVGFTARRGCVTCFHPGEPWSYVLFQEMHDLTLPDIVFFNGIRMLSVRTLCLEVLHIAH